MSEEQRSTPARTSWRHPGPAAPPLGVPRQVPHLLDPRRGKPQGPAPDRRTKETSQGGIRTNKWRLLFKYDFFPPLIHKSCVAAVGSPVKSHVTPRARRGALCSSRGSAVTEPLVSHVGLTGGSWESWNSSPPCSTSLKPCHRGESPPMRLVRGNGVVVRFSPLVCSLKVS